MSLSSHIREAVANNQPDRLRSLLLQLSLPHSEEESKNKSEDACVSSPLDSSLQLAVNLIIRRQETESTASEVTTADSSIFECVSLLLEHGASSSSLSKDGLKGGNIFGLEELFELSLYLSSSPSLSHLPLPVLSGPLRHAIKEGDIKLLESILSKNDKIPNYRDSMGLMPLHYLSMYTTEEHPLLLDVGKLLLEHGAKPNLASRTDLSTPLHYACHHGNTAIVDLLLRESIDPESLLLCQDSLGRTCTHVAIYNDHWDLVSALAQSYKDLLASAKCVVDHKGCNISGALFYARSSSSLPLSHHLLTPCLSKTEADYCLHDAVAAGNDEMVEHAMEGGADVNVFDFCQQSPLILASKLGHHSICKQLLSKGADPSLSDNSGWTPLHYAAANGHRQVIEALLESGEEKGESLDLYPVTNTGSTPLELSLLRERTEVARVILSSTKREVLNGDWMNLLSLAASLNDLSIIKDIVRLFCPQQWARSLGNWIDVPITSPHRDGGDKEEPEWSCLKVLTELPSPPTLFLKDILSPKSAQEKFKKHREFLASSGHCQFVDHNIIFNSKEKRKSRKKRKPFVSYSSASVTKRKSSPIHAMLSAGNIPGLMYLIKEMRKGNGLSLFLETKDIAGISGATLLSKPLTEGLMSADHKLESEILQALEKEYPLPGVSIGWGLLHLLIIKLSLKVVEGKTPLEKWPELLITKKASNFVPSIKHNQLSKLNEAMKLASAILEGEDIAVFFPIFSNRFCSLVFTAAINGVDTKFLKLLLTKGNKSLPSSTPLYFNWFNRNPQKFAITEAIMRGHYSQAEVILDEVSLADMFSALPPRLNEESSEASSLHSSVDEDEICTDVDVSESRFFVRTCQAIHFLSASGGLGFKLALRLLNEMPENYLNSFILSYKSTRCLYLSLHSTEGKDLGVFLFEKLLNYLVKLVQSNKKEYDMNRLLPVVERYTTPNCKWLFDRFNLFHSLVTFLLAVSSDDPLLHEICGRGYTELVKLVFSLTDKGKEGEEERRKLATDKMDSNYTPIYFAASGGHVEIVQFLLEQGATLDPAHYDLYHPLLAVLAYFNNVSIGFQRNGYRTCSRLKLDNNISLFSSGYYWSSRTFLYPTHCEKLVSLVLPDPDQCNQLVQPLQYLLALVNLHHLDLSHFAKLLEIFPTAILSQVTHDEMSVSLRNEKIFLSDYVVSALRHLQSHPSPKLCQKFVLDLVSSLSPSNPHLAAKYFYWDVVCSSIPSRSPRLVNEEVTTCKWGEILSIAVRRGETQVVQHIMIELNNKIKQDNKVDDNTLQQVTVALCKSKMFLEFKEKLFSLPLTDEVVLAGLLTAARFGNFPALDTLADFRERVFAENFNAVLTAGAKAGHDEIIIYLSSKQDYTQCLPGFEGKDKSLSFWTAVLEAAVKGDKTVIAFLAIGSLLQSGDGTNSLTSWSGFPRIVDSCCWWGLGAVLEGMNIDDSNVYLLQVEEHGNVTPFESAVQRGHYALLVSILRGFPRLESVQGMKELSKLLIFDDPYTRDESKFQTLIHGLGRGWWRETMRASQVISQKTKEDEDETNLALYVRPDLFCFRDDENQSTLFLDAVECNIQVIVNSYIHCWGKSAGTIMKAIASYGDLVRAGVHSHSPDLLQYVLQRYFDSNNSVEVGECLGAAISDALSQCDVLMLQVMHKYNMLLGVSTIKYEYNLLHLLAIYAKDSVEVTEYILSLGFEPALLKEKDSNGQTPCECALSIGNYYIAGKIASAMKENGLPLPPSIAEMAVLAIGWFSGFMKINEKEERDKDETDFILPAKGASLRDARTLKEYYSSTRKYNQRAAGVLLEASLGELSSENNSKAKNRKKSLTAAT